MYTVKVFLFVLTLYNKILGELINREGFFVVVVGWLLLSTAVHLLCFQEGRVELWLMPCNGEWYNLSSSWWNWNQLLELVPTEPLSFQGEKKETAVQCSNQEQGISLFFETHFAQVLSIRVWDFSAKVLPAEGGAQLIRDMDVIHSNKWAVASLGLREEFYRCWWWIICVFKFCCKLNRLGNLSGCSCFHTRCSSYVANVLTAGLHQTCKNKLEIGKYKHIFSLGDISMCWL